MALLYKETLMPDNLSGGMAPPEADMWGEKLS